MSRVRHELKTSEPSQEMLDKIVRAREAIANQEARYIKCPYCRHNSFVVYGDTKGHVQSKCSKCGRITVFDVLNMRRVRRRHFSI